MLSYDNTIGAQLETPENITSFLNEFKSYWVKSYHFADREVNFRTIGYLGITPQQARGIIAQLTYKNYYKGPSEDLKRSGCSIWEFGETIQGQEVYIKLSDDFKFGVAICISFHLADYPVKYLYK